MATRTSGKKSTTRAPSGPVRIVFPGSDNRAKVTDTTLQPACWIGQLECSWSDGPKTIGTATLLGDHHILTAAHVVWNAQTKKPAASTVFTPGLNINAAGAVVQPFGTYPVMSWYVPEQYMKIGGPPPAAAGVKWPEVTGYLYDYAVGRLGKVISDPPGPSWFQVNWPGDTALAALTFSINGYSGGMDPAGQTQYSRTGAVELMGDGLIKYRISTFNGDSGAPVYYQPAGKNYWSIIGVHATGVQDTGPGASDGRNFGPAMTGEPLIDVQNALASL